MIDVTQAIRPKSDQLNADDLIAGPKTITISNVTVTPGDQPIAVSYEGDNGKPWKPCKSMSRVMAKAWGANAGNWIGKRVKLYNEPSVKWGGAEVGGIRIAAMSDIPSAIIINLTATRGKRQPYRVEVLQEETSDLAASLKAKFDGCGSLDELRELWEKLPAPLKETALAMKEEAKKRLGA